MKFGVISDIHLEFTRLDRESLERYKGFIDVLCICGDICPVIKYSLYEEFVKMCSEIFPMTLIIPGNHEYYGTSVVAGDRIIRMICSSYDNVHFLNKDKLEVAPGITVYGCTLWTNIPPEHHIDIYRSMNDYKHIQYLTPKGVSKIHESHVDWLRKNLSKDNGIKIVMTHHLPSRALLPKGFNMELVDAYATNITFPKMPHIWLMGHVHAKSDVVLGDTRYIINARGYSPTDQQDECLLYIFVVGP
jgi:predicted phosphohydrolase